MSSTMPPPSVPAVDDTVRMYDNKRDRYVNIPKANQAAAEAKGYTAERGALEAAGLGAAQGATLGYADEIYGAAKALPTAIGEGPGLFTDPESRAAVARQYATSRNEARQAAAEAHEQQPWAYNGAELAGGVASALALPGAGAAIPARLAMNAGLGAAAGLGYSNADNAVDAGVDTAKGAALGAVLPAALETVPVLGRVAGRAAASYAPKALLEQVGMTPKTLGVATRGEAEALAAKAMKEPGLIPPFGKPATAESTMESAMASSADVGAKYGAILKDIDAHHGRPTVSLRELGASIGERTADAVKNEPGWAKYVRKAVRALDPERFDVFQERLQTAVAESPGRAATEAAARFEAQPWLAYGPDAKVTLEQAHEAGQRIRGYGVSFPEPLDSATKDTIASSIYGPAKSTIGGEIRSVHPNVGALQSQYGLHQTIEDAAKKVNNWKNPGAPLAGAVKAGALGAAGAVAGGPVGAVLGAAVPGAAGAIKPHLPRLAEKAGQILPRIAIPEKINRVSAALNRVLAGSPPEKQAQVDFLLQERSPKYREMRQEDEKDPKDLSAD